VHWRRILGEICSEWLQVCGVKNPKGFGFYLYVNRRVLNGRTDMFQHG
jgi:hypothetical protein